MEWINISWIQFSFSLAFITSGSFTWTAPLWTIMALRQALINIHTDFSISSVAFKTLAALCCTINNAPCIGTTTTICRNRRHASESIRRKGEYRELKPFNKRQEVIFSRFPVFTSDLLPLIRKINHFQTPPVQGWNSWNKKKRKKHWWYKNYWIEFAFL